MEKVKLNRLPVPTFGKTGVNYAEREIEGFETETINIDADNSKIIQYTDKGRTFETIVNVPPNTRVKIIQVFDTHEQVNARLKAVLEEDAKLELTQLYIGGDTVSEIDTQLKVRRSEFTANIAYRLDGSDKLDINLIAGHFGKKTGSSITAGGVLGGSAQKTFKGTIDFKNGAVGAKGNEQEETLLLSEKVRNKTVPVILCAEEDVEGNHGANIGRIDDKLVFYMQSRGIPEDRIYELLSKSRLTKVIKTIGDVETEKRIYDSLGWETEEEDI